jgi:hypothetical protein
MKRSVAMLCAAVLGFLLTGCGVAQEEAATEDTLATQQSELWGHYYKCETDSLGYQTGRCVHWFSIACGPVSTDRCEPGAYVPPTGKLCGRYVNANDCTPP